MVMWAHQELFSGRLPTPMRKGREDEECFYYYTTPNLRFIRFFLHFTRAILMFLQRRCEDKAAHTN